MSKRFILILAVVVVGLIGIFAFNRSNTDSPGGSSSGTTSSHLKGNGKKGVTLVEYGDFQCPACKAYFPVVKNLIAKYQEDITLQFRNFPLVQIHPNAFAASRAAEAASLQDKFWEMHDVLYENQDTWGAAKNPVNLFENYALKLGLDLSKFKQDYSSAVVNDTINADIAAGKKANADSTPTFVLDGRKLDANPTSQEVFDKLIAEAIAAKNK